MNNFRRLGLAVMAGAISGAAMAQVPDEAQLKAREELILGKPARIAPPKEISDELRQLALPPPGYGRPGELPENYAIMLHVPELLKIYRQIGTYFLVHGKMSIRDRELVVLRVGWLTGSPYEWGEHVAIGKNRAGLSSDEITRVRIGSPAAEWSEHDRALLKAVEELFDDSMISDATWQVLANTMSEAQLIELPILVGEYQSTAYFLNSMRVRLREGNPGLTAK